MSSHRFKIAFVLCAVTVPLSLTAGRAEDVKVLTADKVPGLHLQLLSPKKQYTRGEPITVTMRYTYTGEQKLSVLIVKFDRSGRVQEYGFTAADADGKAVRDPLAKRESLGGPISETKLTRDEPYEQQATLNEWLAFDKVGRYTIRGHSTIIRVGEKAFEGTPIALVSAPLEIEITPPDTPEVQARREKLLEQVAQEFPTAGKERRTAIMQELRFMMDEKAIPLLALGLEDEWPNVSNEAMTGLMAFTDLSPVKAELLKLINDDSHYIPIRRMQSYVTILVAADKQTGLPGPEGPPTETKPLGAQWYRFLKPLFERKLNHVPADRVAAVTLSGLKWSSLDKNDPANWERILKNIETLPTRGSIDTLQQRDAAELLLQSRQKFPLAARLAPALKMVADNDRLIGPLRLSAMVILRDLGDDSYRDVLVEDVVRAEPRLLWKDAGYFQQYKAVQEVLVEYRAPEVAARLLQLLQARTLRTVHDTPKIYERIRDFGGAASAAELQAAIEKMTDERNPPAPTLLEALAFENPDATIPYIRLLPADPKHDKSHWRRNVITQLATRINTAAGRAFMDELFKSESDLDRVSVVGGLGASAQQIKEKFSHQSYLLPPQPELAARYFPKILHLFRTDPSPEVRIQAHYALGQISGIPKWPAIDRKDADDKTFLPQWEAWWEANRARFE